MNELFYQPPGELGKKIILDERPVDGDRGLDYDRVAAQLLAYYQKVLTPEQRSEIDHHFRATHKELELHPDIEHFEPLKMFSPDERRRIFSNLGSMQLSFGCNGGCEKCGLDALPGVRDQLPFQLVEQFVKEYATELKATKPFLYFASDPLDYRAPRPDGGFYTYVDIENLFLERLGYKPYTSTVIPKGSEAIADSLKKIDRLSIGKNSDFLKKRNLFNVKNAAGEDSRDNVSHNYRVEMLNLGAAHSDFTKEGMAAGIGCFNGMLITPRGVYSVIQTSGWNPYAPQRQYVVPYEGESLERPRVGDDIRDVLKRHMPVFINKVGGSLSNNSWKTGEFESNVYIMSDVGQPGCYSAIIYRGTKVIGVFDHSLLVDLESKLLNYDLICWKYYKKLADDFNRDDLSSEEGVKRYKEINKKRVYYGYAQFGLEKFVGKNPAKLYDVLCARLIYEFSISGAEWDPTGIDAVDRLMAALPKSVHT